jgi:hypothetical protein
MTIHLFEGSQIGGDPEAAYGVLFRAEVVGANVTPKVAVVMGTDGNPTTLPRQQIDMLEAWASRPENNVDLRVVARAVEFVDNPDEMQRNDETLQRESIEDLRTWATDIGLAHADTSTKGQLILGLSMHVGGGRPDHGDLPGDDGE